MESQKGEWSYCWSEGGLLKFFCTAVKASEGAMNKRVAEVVLTAGVKGTAGAIEHREGSGDGG